MDTVTVSRAGNQFRLAFSKLPGQSFGPFGFAEAIRDLRISALLSPLEARNLVIGAATDGSAVEKILGA